MTEISAKEFGKLQSDVEYLKTSSNKHTELLEKMDTKLDGLVTHEQLNKRLEPVENRQIQHGERILVLEQRNTVADASIWRKVGTAFEGNFVKLLGTALVVGIFVLIYFTIVNNNSPQEIIKEVEMIQRKE